MENRYILKRTAAVLCSAAYMYTAAGIYVSAEKPDFNIPVSAPPHIVFMGDSIASGYGLDAYDSEDKSKCASYANILSKVFDSELPKQADFKTANFAKDGLTSGGLLKKLKNGETDSELKDADAVVISIGGNDLLTPIYEIMYGDMGLSETIDWAASFEDQLDDRLEIFENNLPDIVDELYSRSENEDVRIFIQTLYDPLEDLPITKISDIADKKIDRLNDIISQYSEDGEKYNVIPVAEKFEGRAEELTNIKEYDIHPNADGHSEIANLEHDIIEKYTYTYYDNEAAMQYELEQARKKQENAEKERKKEKYITVISAAAAAVIVISGAVFSLRRRKKHTAR